MAHHPVAVGLPVGVGQEADRSVERQLRVHALVVIRVEQQVALQAQLGVENQERHEAEGQQGVGVGVPALLAVGVDAADPIDGPLDRREQAISARTPQRGVIHLRQVAAQQRGRHRDGGDQNGELEPAGGGHYSFSGATSA
jgi:hypothetical protein